MKTSSINDAARIEAILLADRSAAGGALAVPLAGGGRGLRRDRFRRDDAGRRQAHLRTLDPDAQPRQRQGRRHRGRRAGPGRAGRRRRRCSTSDYLLQVAFLDIEVRPREMEKQFIEPFFDDRPGRPDPHGGRLADVPGSGGAAAGCLPLLCPRQARRAGCVRREEGHCGNWTAART